MHPHHRREFHGTTTMGEKGQVVIPVEAREAMQIKKGEKLLVFGMGEDMLVLSKVSNLEKVATHLAERLKGIQEIIKKTR
ncbi:MAG: AbrB/MazE/SpoVT family DNA-binding domain-containing protein [Candidatus Andersenbacteria bacterium]